MDKNWAPSPLEAKRVKVLAQIMGGLAFGLIGGLTFGLIGGLVGGLRGGLIGGLIGALIGMWSNGIRKPFSIKPIHKRRWSWKKAKRGLSIGLIFGIIVGWIVGLIVALTVGPSVGRIVGLIGGLISGLIFGLIGALSGGMSDFEVIEPTKIEQGIQDSFRNAMIGGLTFGLSSGLIFWLAFGLIGWLNIGLIGGLIFGLSVGLSIGLKYGGSIIISHYILRWSLYLSALIPWDLASFLKYATNRIFLRQVGGGFIFIHRTLLEHFAEMWEENIPPCNTKNV